MPPISAMCPIVAGEADELALVEERRDEQVLRHVGAAAVRVVVDDDVARLEDLGAEVVEHAAHGARAIAPSIAGLSSAMRDQLARARSKEQRTRSRAPR